MSKSFKLILVRHGESLANLQTELIGGRSPKAVLSSKGEIQAANLGKYFQKKFLETGQNFDVIYSSPLVRCEQTAKICLQNSPFQKGWTQSGRGILNSPKTTIPKIILDERLIEFSQGDWEGKLRKDIYSLATQNLINKQKTWFCPPNGESLRMLKNRATDFLGSQILDKFYSGDLNDQTVVIFGHGMWIKVLLMEILGLDENITVNLQVDNCSLTKLEFGDFGWRLCRFNYVLEAV
jgi:broad specificity phosphatase PhoE